MTAQTRDAFGQALNRLAAELPRMKDREAGLFVGRLRTMALAEGMMPVAEIADGLAASLRRDRAGTPLAAWIDAMRHAATFPASETGAAPLLMATVGVRLAH